MVLSNNNPSSLPVIAIVGPTASGKSGLAQRVALELAGEVVSADSMQIYRGMNIGTAKVELHEMLVVHHMIDILDPGEPFSAQQFQLKAREVIRSLMAQGTVPVLCGGTGLYVQSVLEDMRFPKGELNSQARITYEKLAEEKGSDFLWHLLQERDSASAEVIHPHNTKRVIRALEMVDEGVSYAEQSKNLKHLPEVFSSLRFGLAVDPEILRQRIDERVDKMLEMGLLDEVTSLLRCGFKNALTAKEAIGYKELVAYLDGTCTYEAAVEQIKQATRRYAKRQRSWLRRDERIIWVDANTASQDDMANVILDTYYSQVKKRD